LGVPPTALLTLIFLQQIHKDKLPELPYITYLDMIYNICYFIILILFVLFLWGSNRLDRATEEEKPAIIEHIDEIDNKFQISLTIFLFVLSAVSWFLFYR
jgi:Ca2+/Na+ antiporter